MLLTAASLRAFSSSLCSHSLIPSPASAGSLPSDSVSCKTPAGRRVTNEEFLSQDNSLVPGMWWLDSPIAKDVMLAERCLSDPLRLVLSEDLTYEDVNCLQDPFSPEDPLVLSDLRDGRQVMAREGLLASLPSDDSA